MNFHEERGILVWARARTTGAKRLYRGLPNLLGAKDFRRHAGAKRRRTRQVMQRVEDKGLALVEAGMTGDYLGPAGDHHQHLVPQGQKRNYKLCGPKRGSQLTLCCKSDSNYRSRDAIADGPVRNGYLVIRRKDAPSNRADPRVSPICRRQLDLCQQQISTIRQGYRLEGLLLLRDFVWAITARLQKLVPLMSEIDQ